VTEDITPAVRPPINNPLNTTLVTVLWNHALVLEETRSRVDGLMQRIAESTASVAPAELAEIGRVFRREQDSAGDVARAAEKSASG